MEVPQKPDPAVLLLGITMTQKDTCTPVFTAALFTVAKTWKQRESPSVEERARKMWCIYNRILLSRKTE